MLQSNGFFYESWQILPLDMLNYKMNTFSKSDGKESSLRRESEVANPGEEYISASSLQRSNQFLFLDPNSQISSMNSCCLCRMRNVGRCEYSNVMIYMTSDDTCDTCADDTYDQ